MQLPHTHAYVVKFSCIKLEESDSDVALPPLTGKKIRLTPDEGPRSAIGGEVESNATLPRTTGPKLRLTFGKGTRLAIGEQATDDFTAGPCLEESGSSVTLPDATNKESTVYYESPPRSTRGAASCYRMLGTASPLFVNADDSTAQSDSKYRIVNDQDTTADFTSRNNLVDSV